MCTVGSVHDTLRLLWPLKSRFCRRVRLWLNRTIVKYELWHTILPILRLFLFSNFYTFLRFFRLLLCHFSDSPNSTRFSNFSDYTILLIVILWFFRFSSPSSTRFSDFSDYTILLIVILRFFRISEFYAILLFFRLFFWLLFSDFSDYTILPS